MFHSCCRDKLGFFRSVVIPNMCHYNGVYEFLDHLLPFWMKTEFVSKSLACAT